MDRKTFSHDSTLVGRDAVKAARAIAALLLVAGLAGCAFTRQPIPGLLVEEGETPSQTVDRIQVKLRAIEEGLRKGPLDGAPKTSPDGAVERLAMLRILDAFVSLSGETLRSHTGLDPYDFPDRRKPLFIYPRITAPLIAECARSGPGSVDQAPPGTPAAPEERAFVLPIILNKQAFMLPKRPSWVLGSLLSPIIPDPRSDLPDTPREMAAQIREDFHFTLVPRRLAAYDEIPLDEPPAAPVEIPAVEIPLPASSRGESHAEGEVFRVPVQGRNVLELAFRLPAAQVKERWEKRAASEKRPIRGELLDLRMFPRLAPDKPDRAGSWGNFMRALRKGRWLAAHEALSAISADANSTVAREDLGMYAEDCEAILATIDRFTTRYPYFAPELELLAQRTEALGEIAADAAEEPEQARAVPGAIRDLLMAVGIFIGTDPCPAPIYLDEPEPAKRSFSFIVGADLQYDTDGSSFQQFLAMIDPGRIPQATSAESPFAQLPEDLQRELIDAKFVIIDGDLGDGKGFSSTPSSLLVDALGLGGANSPYVDGSAIPKLGEFPELRSQMLRCAKPIFAVPGNHDGFCAFGGVLNQLAAAAGGLIECIPLLGILGTPLKENIAPGLPTLVRLWRIAPPFYDGLVDWSLELGPHNVAFNYRGCAFVAANSFDLHQLERDQVGAIGNNWGGGLQEETLIWFDMALRHFAHLDRGARGMEGPKAPAQSFVFLHHDPRASLASKRGYEEVNFGHYNDITTPVNELTLGYFGLSWATYSGLFIPLVSPIFVGVLREASTGENFQERWMRHTAWDESCYHGKEALDVISRNVTGAPPIENEATGATYPPARISHLFFGHDDTPVVGPWVRPNGNAVFPGQPSDAGWNTVGHTLKGIFKRTQSACAPGWAAAMHFDDGRQATVVRLDDLGDVYSKVNTHGFSLVTVHFPEDDEGSAVPPGDAAKAEAGPGGDRPGAPRVDVRWIPVPR